MKLIDYGKWTWIKCQWIGEYRNVFQAISIFDRLPGHTSLSKCKAHMKSKEPRVKYIFIAYYNHSCEIDKSEWLDI